MQNSKNKILLFTSCGHSLKNKGDHAMLAGLLDWLEQNHKPSDIIVFSTEPDEFRNTIKVRTVWSPEMYFMSLMKWQNPKNPIWALLIRLITISKGIWFIANFFIYKFTDLSLIKNRACTGFYSQLLEAKALILSGGGYINSIWWLYGLYLKAFPVITAKLINVPVLLTSHGIGPFNHTLDRLVAKTIFKYSDFIGVRDGDTSKSVVEGLLGKSEKKVVHTGDDALLLKTENSSGLKKITEAEKIPADTMLIGVNLRDVSLYPPDFVKSNVTLYAQLLDNIVSAEKRHLVFVPISYNHGDDDRLSAEQIVENMHNQNKITLINNEYTPAQLGGLAGLMHLSIGTSYHFLLFSLSQNVPAMGLYQNEYYEQKLKGLFSLYNLDNYCIYFDRSDYKVALHLVNDLIARSRDISERLSLRNEILQKSMNYGHELLERKLK